jgi:hypothetical protein
MAIIHTLDKKRPEPNIKQTLAEFLDDQKMRLKKKTFENYKNVIVLFESHLNNYAHQVLAEKERKYFDDQYDNHNREFCELFGPDKILGGYNEFFGYFLPRKVIAGEEFFKNCGTVLKKLAKWMETKGYTGPEDSLRAIEASARGGKNAAEAERIGRMLYNFKKRYPLKQTIDQDENNFVESYFTIERVEKNILHLQDDESPDEEVYAVKVPASLAGKLAPAVGWQVWLGLIKAKTKGMEEWNIVEVGNVYPTRAGI